MQNKHYYFPIYWVLLFLGVGIQPAIAQMDHVINLERRADVLDGAVASEFNKLPELKSSGGELSLHLYVNEELYDFVGSKIKMRTYTYESGEQESGKIGPWGPVLRINQNDRLNITVHNNLPSGADKNYLGSMDLVNTSLLKEGEVSIMLQKAMIEGTTYKKDTSYVTLIKPENLINATLKVVEPGKKWMVKGQELCQCPPGQLGMCVKADVYYPIEQRYNYISHKNTLRIYQLGLHGEDHEHNDPHGFNTTNMHTHGFHVSPFQDDIFRKVPPGESSLYTYKLEDHTPGTMWYHPHVHGSTALQVASGMSGVIIIEDPNLSGFPDLAAASKKEQERILMFNQILYDEEIGELPDFNTLNRAYAKSNHGPKGTTINGVTLPKMRIERGEVQRWRMVHSGYRSSMALQFPEELEVLQIAVDGIMFDKARRIRTLHMAPGNRMDILVKAPKSIEKKNYDVMTIKYKPKCEYFPNDPTCTNLIDNKSEAMMKIVVGGDRTEMGLPDLLPGPEDHPDIQNKEVVNLGAPRKTRFDITFPNKGVDFEINGAPFKGDTIHEILTLGTAEDWELSSGVGSHPYHIHINPFQVREYNGLEVSPPMWKDVVMVPTDKDTLNNPFTNIIIRSRYTRYWGDFVLHCHLLHHEDQGMMQRIRIRRKEEK